MDLDYLKQEARDSLHVLMIEFSHAPQTMTLIKDITAYLEALEKEIVSKEIIEQPYDPHPWCDEEWYKNIGGS